MIFSDLVKAFQNNRRKLHDIRFVHAGDLLPVFAQRIVKRELRDARRSFLGNDLRLSTTPGMISCSSPE